MTYRQQAERPYYPPEIPPARSRTQSYATYLTFFFVVCATCLFGACLALLMGWRAVPVTAVAASASHYLAFRARMRTL